MRVKLVFVDYVSSGKQASLHYFLASSGQVDQSTPVSANGSIDEVVRGDDYLDDSAARFLGIFFLLVLYNWRSNLLFRWLQKDRGSWLVQVPSPL